MKINIKLPHTVKIYLAKLKVVLRHHFFIVMVLMLSGLGYAIYTVNETLNTPSDENYHVERSRSTIGSKFNQSTRETIEKVKALQKSSDPTSGTTPFPAGRINPFAE